MTDFNRTEAKGKKSSRVVKGCRTGCLALVVLALAAIIFIPRFLRKGFNEADTIMTQLVPGMTTGDVESITTPFIENGKWRKDTDTYDLPDDPNLPDISKRYSYFAIWRPVNRDYDICIYLVFDQDKQKLIKAVRVDHGDSGNLWIEDIKGDDPQLRHQTFLGFENGARVKTGGYCEYRH